MLIWTMFTGNRAGGLYSEAAGGSKYANQNVSFVGTVSSASFIR